MWVILIAGFDTGISIQGSDYYSTLLAAIAFITNEAGWLTDIDVIDIVKPERV